MTIRLQCYAIMSLSCGKLTDLRIVMGFGPAGQNAILTQSCSQAGSFFSKVPCTLEKGRK